MLKVSDSPTNISTFGGSSLVMTLLGCKQEDIIKFMECIGHYYYKINNPEIYGFLLYKANSSHRHIMKFTDWLKNYYGFGNINDDILSIEYIPGEHDVFDCSFDEHHWYLTNGFISHNCNYPHKVIPALHSRTQGFHIEKLDREQFAAKAATILMAEGVELDEDSLEILDEYITVTYPDLRKCINLLQQNTSGTNLTRPSRSSNTGSGEYMIQAVALFKTGRISEARKLICQNATVEEYEDIYKMLYQNLEWWGDTEEQQNRAIVIIANRLRDHAICADGEMNLAACLVELNMIG